MGLRPPPKTMMKGARLVAIRILLELEDEAGLYRVLSVGADTAHGGGGRIYVNIACRDGSGYSKRCSGYTEAADIVFAEYGQFLDP